MHPFPDLRRLHHIVCEGLAEGGYDPNVAKPVENSSTARVFELLHRDTHFVFQWGFRTVHGVEQFFFQRVNMQRDGDDHQVVHRSAAPNDLHWEYVYGDLQESPAVTRLPTMQAVIDAISKIIVHPTSEKITFLQVSHEL